MAELWPVERSRAEASVVTDRRPQLDAESRAILAARSGDADAFEILVKRHEPAIARQMWRFSRDLRARNELVQDVFVEAYLSLKSYRPGTPFLHWLRRIATRVGYRHWEGLERQKRHVQIEAAPLAGPAGGESSPAEKAAALLDRILARLGAEDRLVLTLMYFDGCDLREVSERTGWNRAIVAMRAYRARRRLKRIIERENLLGELPWLS